LLPSSCTFLNPSVRGYFLVSSNAPISILASFSFEASTCASVPYTFFEPPASMLVLLLELCGYGSSVGCA